MRNIAFPNLLKTFREYVLMTAGLLIYSFGWIACIKPMEVAAGGGTGLAMIATRPPKCGASTSASVRSS